MESDQSHLECFKAYDIRGKVPDELDAHLTELIGWSYAQLIQPRRVVVGHDARLTGDELTAALCRGLTTSGVDVAAIGLAGTEEVYFATFYLEVDGGVVVTASHNPRDYNGLKFTRDLAKPISADTGLHDMEQSVLGALRGVGGPAPAAAPGSITPTDTRAQYVEHLLTYVDLRRLRPLKIVVNAGNGCAGPVVDLLEPRLPFRFVKLNNEPDGSFPAGVPNPMLPENRSVTAEAVLSEKADLGIAWDGDFDRCFFFDEKTNFIEGYYIVGLLAREMLKTHPGSKIILDPRLTWNTIEQVESLGGTPVVSKTGHAFIKERMRKEDAVYGGEMSAHHYFRDFYYCDTGMVPFLLISALLSAENKTLGQLVSGMMAKHPCSGEINFQVANPPAVIKCVEEEYKPRAKAVDYIDGLSMEFSDWRFNLRMSNTEPLIRLNVETRGDRELMQQKTQELQDFIKKV